jgi:chromosomal replication initiation ATPase DnaA
VIPIIRHPTDLRARARRFGDAVAAEYEQPLDEILGASTMRCFAEPRFVLCWLLRASGERYSAISRTLGLDRVIVRSAALKLEGRLMRDDALDRRVTALIERLNLAARRSLIAHQADAEEYAELRG